MVKSLMDYMGRWLALKFLTKDKAMQFHNKELVEKSYSEGTKSKDAFAMRLPVIDEGSQQPTSTIEEAFEEKLHAEVATAVAEVGTVETKAEKAKLQGYTGSICTECTSIRMKQNGSCEVCLDCGATSGCS